MKFPTALLALLPALTAAAPQAPMPSPRVSVPANQFHLPTHPGTPANCTAYYKVSEGDICLFVASDFGITLDQLAAWNSVGGRDCPYLWVGYYVCVAVTTYPTPTPTPTPTPGVVPVPVPTQEGVAGDCTKWHYLELGDVCFRLADEYGIRIEDVIRWNPAAGQNCTGLMGGYWACVGVEAAEEVVVGETVTTLG